MLPPGLLYEEKRLQALQRYGILDTPPESEYDDIVQLAARLCDVPIALVSLVDRDRQWFKANVGLPGVSETERCISFCTFAIEQEHVFVVEDATQDARFASNRPSSASTRARPSRRRRASTWAPCASSTGSPAS